MRLGVLIIAALLVCAAETPTFSKGDINVPANAGWQHFLTKLILRQKLAGLTRTQIVDATEAELDVTLQYGTTATTALTVYIFRPALMSVPVWFDRSEAQILGRDTFAGAFGQGEPKPFAPPRSAVESGLRRIYILPSTSTVRATGLATMPLGEWLVVIRISSVELTAEQLDAKLSEAIAALGWPESVADAPGAVPVLACSSQLKYAKKAKLVAPDMTQVLLASALAATQNEKTSDEPIPVWCRESGGLSYGVYRFDQRRGYLMALGDAGRTIRVSPELALFDSSRGKYALSFGDLDHTAIYPSFDRLPDPETAFAAAQRARVVSTVSLGEKKNITIGK